MAPGGSGWRWREGRRGSAWLQSWGHLSPDRVTTREAEWTSGPNPKAGLRSRAGKGLGVRWGDSVPHRTDYGFGATRPGTHVCTQTQASPVASHESLPRWASVSSSVGRRYWGFSRVAVMAADSSRLSGTRENSKHSSSLTGLAAQPVSDRRRRKATFEAPRLSCLHGGTPSDPPRPSVLPMASHHLTAIPACVRVCACACACACACVRVTEPRGRVETEAGAEGRGAARGRLGDLALSSFPGSAHGLSFSSPS